MEVPVEIGAADSPLNALIEGKEQVIKVDFKTVLIKVMSAVGVSSRPVFKEIECGREGVKVSVKLDAKFPNHPEIPVIEGRVFMSTAAAEASAVSNVLSYLERNCLVKVLDFSSRVALSYIFSKDNSNAGELSESVSQVLDHFEGALQNCCDFMMHVQVEGEPYDGVRDFMRLLVKDYSKQASSLRVKLNSIESERVKQYKVQAELRQCALGKVFFKKVHLSSKMLLEHVLLSVGLKNAKYNNGPDDNGRVDALAEFTAPFSKHCKFGGNIQIRAKGNTSASAEENAAHEALSFFLENFRVIFVDLNYCQRIDAENDHFRLKRLLVEIAEVGKSAKEMWDSFMKKLSGKIEELTSLSNSVIQEDGGLELYAAYKFLVEGLEVIDRGAMECVVASWAMSDLMDGMTEKLDAINLKDH